MLVQGSQSAESGNSLEAAHDELVGLDRSGWAWEWLRRNPSYRVGAMKAAQPATSAGLIDLTGVEEATTQFAACWGLHFRRRSASLGSDSKVVLAG